MGNEEDVDKLRQQIHGSSGMGFVRRMNVRSFSLRIFTMNAHRIENAFMAVEEKSRQFLSDDTEDVTRQTNLAITYLLHNFVASAKTLVDHTRIFLDMYYTGAPVANSYQGKIDSEIAVDKVCRFVHDLRNYPALRFTRHVGVGFARYAQQNRIGVRMDVRTLLKWDRWSSLSRSFLEEHDKFIDPGEVARAYYQKIIGLHTWLDQLLSDYHQHDLANLKEMTEK